MADLCLLVTYHELLNNQNHPAYLNRSFDSALYEHIQHVPITYLPMYNFNAGKHFINMKNN